MRFLSLEICKWCNVNPSSVCVGGFDQLPVFKDGAKAWHANMAEC